VPTLALLMSQNAVCLLIICLGSFDVCVFFIHYGAQLDWEEFVVCIVGLVKII
jgi:hypothetical protein